MPPLTNSRLLGLFLPAEQWRRNRLAINIAAALVIPQETWATSCSFLASASLPGAALGPVVAGALTHPSMRAIVFFNGFVFLLLLGYAWRSIGPAIQAAARTSTDLRPPGSDVRIS